MESSSFGMLAMTYHTPSLQQLANSSHGHAIDPRPTPPLMGFDMDRNSDFDVDTFEGREDMSFGRRGLVGPMSSLRRHPSTYDDRFSDVVSHVSHYDQPPTPEPATVQEPSIECGHKILSFYTPTCKYNLLNYANRRTTLSLTAQLHGMFFLAVSPGPSTSEATAPPGELTCYRRNLFQISGSLVLPRGLRYVLNDQNQQVPVLPHQMELTMSATESAENNPVKIISVPSKTPAAGQPVVDDKSEKEPPSIPIDLMNGQEIDGDLVNFPIDWKRLQFRIATANNGRRKELQQHFTIHLKLMASLADAAQTRVTLCEATSGAVIVRGRSPRNFQSRKDIAISQSGGSTRNRNNHHMSGGTKQHTSRQSNATSSVTLTEQRQLPDPPHSAPLDMPSNPWFDSTHDHNFSPTFIAWRSPGSNHAGPAQHGGAMTTVPPDYAVSFTANPPATGAGGRSSGYARSNPDLTQHATANRVAAPRSTPAAPRDLRATDDDEDEARPASASPAQPSTKKRRCSSSSPPLKPAKSRKLAKLTSPSSSAASSALAVTSATVNNVVPPCTTAPPVAGPPSGSALRRGAAPGFWPGFRVESGRGRGSDV